ncbi:hypothetical protein J010_02426 [Cryptococcus neoformans]|uniref:Uncharacterized protein n=1 Tax=Cryptococcus neoformans Tu259-1 TaxID=1230072 RepID=A0A854QC70_CRYNE|nr:hypothetical protein C361_02870 [Cryptococcus neoformans var. grubii Tu259-1]OXG51458.1 hypothetical protein C355_02349 [Cryptococcus neoformans var. grubii Th84]OXG89077.1 hypothetical protein C346_02505 [Cryptococcus neoformans var. grubii D17-1]OXG97093.1 hypothetical protein C345_02373 [Cryptococcus neoformans var. grubii A2-102-5]OXH13023.1 hypothetical protein J010_02426 [Cryptococcus neoformans var. grubii]
MSSSEEPSTKGKERENPGSINVTHLSGPARLSTTANTNPSHVTYSHRHLRDALTGGPADPSMIQGLSSDFVKYPSWRSNSVTHTMLPVSGTQRHRFLILPGITDEGQFVYDTLLALRERSKYKQSSLDSYRESQWCEPPEVDTWWDEEVKKGTEWYKEYCKVTGFDPTNPSNKQRALSEWSSTISSRLRQKLESEHRFRQQCTFPTLSVITEKDIDVALQHRFSFQDENDIRIDIDPRATMHDWSILRLELENNPKVWRRDQPPSIGSHARVLIHSNYSYTGLPDVVTKLALPSNPEDLYKTSPEIYAMFDPDNKDAQQWLQGIIDRATEAFSDFDRDRGRSAQIKDGICGRTSQDWERYTDGPQKKAECLSAYTSAYLQNEFNQHTRDTNVGRSSQQSYLIPQVEPVHGYDDYTWNKSLETGTFDPTFFRGTGKIVDLVANDVKRRLCAGTMVNGDISQATPEGAPPPYEYSEILPVRCEAGSSNLAASTQISGGGKSTKGDVLPPHGGETASLPFQPNDNDHMATSSLFNEPVGRTRRWSSTARRLLCGGSRRSGDISD